MDANLLFIDDCVSERLPKCGCRISSITGILLTQKQCQEVRKEILRIIQPLSKEKNGFILPTPKELHGSNFLRSEPDDVKLEIYQQISLLPQMFDFSIYRVGLFLTSDFIKLFKVEAAVSGWLWLKLLSVMQKEFEDNFIIPVMDGFNKHTVEHFSGGLNRMNYLGELIGKQNISILNYENILTECLFADSRYSYLTQLADNISYLRNLNDLKSEGWKLGKFKSNLWSLNHNLGCTLKHDDIVEMNVRVVDRIKNIVFNIQ